MSKIEKTNEFNFKDFFLDEEEIKNPEEQEKTKKSTSKSEVVYSVEWANHCDCIIKRATKQTEKYLALLVSKGQYYIKDNNGSIEQLTLDSFVKFFDKLDKTGIDINTTWVKHLPKGKKENEHLLRVLNSENFKLLAKNNLIYAPSFSYYSSFEVTNHFFIDHLNILKKIKDLLCLDMEETEAKTLIREKLNNRSYGYYGRQISNIPQNLLTVVSVCFDYDHIRPVDFFERDCITNYSDNDVQWKFDGYGNRDEEINTSAIELLYNTFGESGLFNLLNSLREQGTNPADEMSSRATTDYMYELLTNVEFKCEKFIEYITYQPMVQGYSFTNLLQDWKDDLRMQLQLYGEIKDKYPEHLSSTHQKHSHSIEILEAVREAMEKDKKNDELKERMKAIKSYCWKPEEEKYLITTPNSIEDVLQEARDMSNCLASYVNTIASGQTNVFFLRNKKTPEIPFVDIEVRGNKLRQAYCSHNRKPTKEVMEFIHKWCDKKKIEYTAEYYPQRAD